MTTSPKSTTKKSKKNYLQVSKWIINDLTETGKPVLYDLYAVTNHFGGLGGGHYTAFAKNKFDNQWYNFDDSNVSVVSNPEQAIITTAAYVLFYKKR